MQMNNTNLTPFTGNYFYGCGKRKTAIAKVRLYEKGTGEIKVNGQDIKEWLDHTVQLEVMLTALKETGLNKKFNISVVVNGGGKQAQSEAIRLGVAKALVAHDATLRATLKPLGLLSRDDRIKERKKPGLRSARRAEQFSKR